MKRWTTWTIKKIKEYKEKNPNGIEILLIEKDSFKNGYFHVFLNSHLAGFSRKYTYKKCKKFFENF